MLKGGIENITKSKSKMFFSFCFCFLCTTFFISLFDFRIDFVNLIIFSLVIISFVAIFFNNKCWRFIFLSLFFICLSCLHYLFFLPRTDSKNISFYNNQEKIVQAYVSSEPDVRLDGVRYTLESTEIIFGKENQKVTGKIYLKSGLYPRYDYGDELLLNCKLKKPEIIEDFRYDKYLARYGVFSICQVLKIEKIAENKGNIFLKYIFYFKKIVADKINQLWHEPNASFMAGLLYGYRGGLGTLNEKFSITGVTHIVAISGYNISLISSILITICIQMYLPRKKAFYLIVTTIFIFVIFAGASASVVRAGIMGVVVLLAKQIGRASKIYNVLILTAVVMALINPYILAWDAGFQLSFLATIGLIYLSPVLKPYFLKIPENFSLQENLLSTLSAIIITLPLILFQFGRLSIVAPIVNILILWILPWIMFLGFLATLFSFFFNPLAFVFSALSWLTMEYVIKIVSFFSSLKFASSEIKFNIFLLIVAYFFIFYLIFKKRKNI